MSELVDLEAARARPYARSIPDRRGDSGAEVADLALDLGLDVERLLAVARAPLVAGDHELADLVAQLGIDRRRGEQRRSSASTSSGASPRASRRSLLGLEHLADLVVALGARRARRAGGRAGRSSVVERRTRPCRSRRRPARADEASIAATTPTTRPRRRSRCRRPPPGLQSAHVGRLTRTTMAPSRPAVFPEQIGLAGHRDRSARLIALVIGVAGGYSGHPFRRWKLRYPSRSVD